MSTKPIQVSVVEIPETKPFPKIELSIDAEALQELAGDAATIKKQFYSPSGEVNIAENVTSVVLDLYVSDYDDVYDDDYYDDEYNTMEKLEVPVSQGDRVFPILGASGQDEGAMIVHSIDHESGLVSATYYRIDFEPEELTLCGDGDDLIAVNVLYADYAEQSIKSINVDGSIADLGRDPSVITDTFYSGGFLSTQDPSVFIGLTGSLPAAELSQYTQSEDEAKQLAAFEVAAFINSAMDVVDLPTDNNNPSIVMLSSTVIQILAERERILSGESAAPEFANRQIDQDDFRKILSEQNVFDYMSIRSGASMMPEHLLRVYRGMLSDISDVDLLEMQVAMGYSATGIVDTMLRNGGVERELPASALDAMATFTNPSRFVCVDHDGLTCVEMEAPGLQSTAILVPTNPVYVENLDADNEDENTTAFNAR